MDLEGYLRFLLALVFVLGLIAALTVAAKRLGLGYRTVGKGTAGRRLAVVEVMPIDGKRRLMLVRRDSTDHLILLGATTDLIIEGGIPAPSPATTPAATAQPQ